MENANNNIVLLQYIGFCKFVLLTETREFTETYRTINVLFICCYSCYRLLLNPMNWCILVYVYIYIFISS